MDYFSDPLTLIAIAIPVVVAITFHEAAHGIVAWRLGDDTAYTRGRVALNPLKHIDAFGTILLPAMLIMLSAPFLFGWAKPVPVNFGRLHRPRRDMVLVAAAGPGTNLLLAVISAMLMHVAVVFPESVAHILLSMLNISIFINILLAVFNMLPLPPLDGGRVAVGLLPEPLAFRLARLERYGLFILIGVLFVLPMLGRVVGLEFEVFHWVILPVVDALRSVILVLTGIA